MLDQGRRNAKCAQPQSNQPSHTYWEYLQYFENKNNKRCYLMRTKCKCLTYMYSVLQILSKSIFPNGQQIANFFSSLSSKLPSMNKCLVDSITLMKMLSFLFLFLFLLYMLHMYNIIIQHLYTLHSDDSKVQLPPIMLPLTPFTPFAYSPIQILSGNHWSLLCKCFHL